MNWPLAIAWGVQAFQLYLMVRMRDRHRAEVARLRDSWEGAELNLTQTLTELRILSRDNKALRAELLRARNDKS